MIRTLLIIFLFVITTLGQTSQISYLRFTEVEPILKQLGNDVPSELRSIKGEPEWQSWVKNSDAQIRRRLELGDEDSIVNQFLFGTSFTQQPRLTETEIGRLANEKSIDAVKLYELVLGQRLEEYAIAVGNSKNNERISFASDYLRKKLNVDLATAQGKLGVKKFVISSLARVLSEAKSYTEIIQQTRIDTDEEFQARSRVYQSRGLSSDTSLKPNFAIEEALKQLRQKGLLKRVTRVAIIGPGLDFTDKDQGYDFYPPQTIQPFAVVESLLKSNLASSNSIRIDTYDLSPKVNYHIEGFVKKFARRENYLMQLPLSTDTNWTSDFRKYWSEFGHVIGKDAKPISTNLRDLNLRAVSVNSLYLGKIKSFDANIVLQSPSLSEIKKYDLIIGTNIFVYYGKLEQALAMKNLEKMLKSDGVLLSNDSLTEIQTTKLRSIGKTEIHYSDKSVDGDRIIWYQRQK